MTEEELYNEYRKSDCKSFTDFLINKITELKKTYRKQRNKRIDELQKENKELKEQISIKDILIKELQEQKVYWKESSFDWRHKFFKLDKVKRLIKKDRQLTKAKELLERLLITSCNSDVLSLLPNRSEVLKVRVEAEQFISEVENV